MTRTIALVAVLAATLASAPVVAPHYFYLDPARLDLSVLLPPPPDAASAAERSDEEQVAAAVAQRRPAQLFEAEEASKRSVFFFAASIGPRFTAAQLPITAILVALEQETALARADQEQRPGHFDSPPWGSDSA